MNSRDYFSRDEEWVVVYVIRILVMEVSMMKVSLVEVKVYFSEFVNKVEVGEIVEIMRYGKLVVCLVLVEIFEFIDIDWL